MRKSMDRDNNLRERNDEDENEERVVEAQEEEEGEQEELSSYDDWAGQEVVHQPLFLVVRC